MVSQERLKELIEIKNKQRAALKAEYVKQITDPHKYAKAQGGAVVSSLIFIFIIYCSGIFDINRLCRFNVCITLFFQTN